MNTHRATTEEEMRKMITLSGGTVKRAFSKNTAYFLASKSANTSKTKSTNERQVEVANLRRLQKAVAWSTDDRDDATTRPTNQRLIQRRGLLSIRVNIVRVR